MYLMPVTGIRYTENEKTPTAIRQIALRRELGKIAPPRAKVAKCLVNMIEAGGYPKLAAKQIEESLNNNSSLMQP